MFYQYNHLGSPDYLKTEVGCDFCFPPHLHQCFEVIVITRGEMEVTVDGRPFLLKEKEALLIFPNQIHALQSEKSEHVLCIFSPRLVQAYATGVAGKLPESNRFIPDDYLVQALYSLSPTSGSAEKKGVLYSLCSQFDKGAVYLARTEKNDKPLLRIFSFVEAEYAGDCSLKALAEQLGYDYSYLSRLFKRIVGLPFNTYVNHYRLSHACYLMENTDHSILKCALDSGYTSLRSFNRNFALHFHMTPTQYRDRMKKHQPSGVKTG